MKEVPAPGIEYEIKPQNKLSLGLAELWHYRELFYFFTWRDIKVKYKQTMLGFAWAVIQPLVMTLLLTFGFGKMISENNQLGMPYPLFAISGLVIWNIFSSGLSGAGNSMVTNANIIKKIYFPRLIIPISSVLVSLFDFLMAFAIFIVMLFYYKIDLNIFYFITMLLASVFLTCVATFGSGTLLAALNIKYRDFRYVIPFMIQALLFLTPVIYPLSASSRPLVKTLLSLNPMYAPIELFRSGIVQHPLELNYLVTSIVSGIVLFFAGLYYFRKTESYFADLA
jgi:lipopolysaccharide transport system permease protein